MFSLLSDKLDDAFRKMRGLSKISESNIKDALRDVRMALLDADVDAVTGRGGGITDESFQKKKAVIKTATEISKPDKNDVVDVLAKVGGFDIAAMCGAFLGCAISRRPVVIDGFISAVAALCACRLCPHAGQYFIPSHAS